MQGLLGDSYNSWESVREEEEKKDVNVKRVRMIVPVQLPNDRSSLRDSNLDEGHEQPGITSTVPVDAVKTKVTC